MSQHLNLETIRDYLRDHLDESARRSVESHLSRCAACRQALEAERRMSSILALAGPSEAAAIRLEDVVRRTEAQFDAGKRTGRRGVALFTCLLVGLLAGAVLQRVATTTGPQRPAVVDLSPAQRTALHVFHEHPWLVDDCETVRILTDMLAGE